MKRASLGILCLLLAGVLAACGAGDSPEKAAREWLQAMTNLDGNKIVERTCAEQQANVQEAGLWLSVFGLLGQSQLGEQAKADFSA
jgi:hypothetical protein